MKRFCCLILVALCLAGCAPMHPIADTAPPLPPENPTTEATTQPATQPAVQPAEIIPTTEPQQFFVEVFREGESSQIPVEIVQGTVGSYTIAMDPEYFTFHPQEAVDLFSYDAWEEGPGVFYAISDYRDDADPQQFAADTTEQYAPLFASCSTEETTLGGYPATAVYLSNFALDSAYQYHIFLINCDGNYYLLEASFTFEMYEGLYAIMRACFDTMAPLS